eukprot:scaffold54486_cov31-Tisochrysis_lutea.AAC.1
MTVERERFNFIYTPRQVHCFLPKRLAAAGPLGPVQCPCGVGFKLAKAHGPTSTERVRHQRYHNLHIP